MGNPTMLTVLRLVTELVDWRLGELEKGRSSLHQRKAQRYLLVHRICPVPFFANGSLIE